MVDYFIFGLVKEHHMSMEHTKTAKLKRFSKVSRTYFVLPKSKQTYCLIASGVYNARKETFPLIRKKSLNHSISIIDNSTLKCFTCENDFLKFTCSLEKKNCLFICRDFNYTMH